MEFSDRRLLDVVIAAPVGRIDHASAEVFKQKLEPLLAHCTEGSDRLVPKAAIAWYSIFQVSNTSAAWACGC